MDDIINSRRQTDRQNEASHEYRSISAQSLVTSKSFYQTLRGYFATTKIFDYPDIEIVQEGDKKGFITYTGYPEHEGLSYRGVGVEIKSQRRKTIVFNGHASLLESITFATDAPLQERDTCILFSWKNDLYSESALRKMIEANKTDGDNFDIILFTERERQLHIEILSDVIIDTAFKVAKSLQNLKDGQQVIKFKDALMHFESGDQDKQITDLHKPSISQQKRKPNIKRECQLTLSTIVVTIDQRFRVSKFPGRYHKIHEKEIRKETTERENESTTNLSPDIFAKSGNSEVWKFMNERIKIPNTCKGKQTRRHRLNQEINWDELVQGIIVPDIDRAEDDKENGCFGGNLDKIKTEVIKPEHELDKTVNTTKQRRKNCANYAKKENWIPFFFRADT